jgi:hypothetical protein
MNTSRIDDLWDVFHLGDRQTLASAHCPACGGRLMWSPAIHSKTRLYQGTQRHPLGLSVYCLGRCNQMLGHWDGIAPDWAVCVADWNAFNRDLHHDEIA